MILVHSLTLHATSRLHTFALKKVTSLGRLMAMTDASGEVLWQWEEHVAVRSQPRPAVSECKCTRGVDGSVSDVPRALTCALRSWPKAVSW